MQPVSSTVLLPPTAAAKAYDCPSSTDRRLPRYSPPIGDLSAYHSPSIDLSCFQRSLKSAPTTRLNEEQQTKLRSQTTQQGHSQVKTDIAIIISCAHDELPSMADKAPLTTSTIITPSAKRQTTSLQVIWPTAPRNDAWPTGEL